jgi:hypothetical protein
MPSQCMCSDVGPGHDHRRSRIIYLDTSFRKSTALPPTVTVTVTDNLLQHELQKSLHPSPVVSRLLRPPRCLDYTVTV